MSRHRNYCFTINNYNSLILDNLEKFSISVRYLVYGKEVGELGTPHIQGYVEFNNPRTISGFNKAIGCEKGECWANCEPRWGTPKQAAGYCKKGDEEYHDYSLFFDNPSNSWDGKEFGTISNQGRRVDLEKVVEEVSTGILSVESLANDQPMLFHQYSRTLYKVEDIHMRSKVRKEMTEGIWYYGKTGVGKSHKAFENFSTDTHYVYPNDKGWCDGYRQQDIFIMNDFRGSTMNYNELLNLVDKWPFYLKRRCREPISFTSKQVIITSSLSPQEVFKNRELEDSLDQLLRRFKVIKMT